MVGAGKALLTVTRQVRASITPVPRRGHALVGTQLFLGIAILLHIRVALDLGGRAGP